jgi:hypothetical protein
MAAHTQKGKIHLQGAVAQKPQKLYLRSQGCGHKVDKAYPERAYILPFGAVMGHYKNPFPVESLISRQFFWYLYWHGINLAYSTNNENNEG